jgi:pyruvoyl-dependent arginine decarboxylase (PvlArgDC)
VGEPTLVVSEHRGRGLRHQADEVARRLAAGDLESSLMPLDETISIMETMDAVLAQATDH